MFGTGRNFEKRVKSFGDASKMVDFIEIAPNGLIFDQLTILRRNPRHYISAEMTRTDDFGGDGGRVGGIEHDNPPLDFTKDFIYGEKKIERPSVLGESSLRTYADLCGRMLT